MSVDAACAVCCCPVAPPVCCFPDASKTLEYNWSMRSSVFAGTVEVSRTLISGQVSTTMIRWGTSAAGFSMQSSGGSAALRYETFSKVSKIPFSSQSCPGFPNEYVCPSCNDFVECQSFEWTYSGSLANAAMQITCVDPCSPFGGARKTFVLSFNPPQSGQFVGNALERTGNNEPTQVAVCGAPASNQYPLDLLSLGIQIAPTVYGREGCLASSTFQNGFIAGHPVGIPLEFDGPCSANPTYSASLDCGQWQANPAYSIPARMGYLVSSCPVLRCNPYSGDASARGSPVECILFDCNGNVINYAVSGCDSIYPGNGQGTGCEISVRAELSLSASVTYV